MPIPPAQSTRWRAIAASSLVIALAGCAVVPSPKLAHSSPATAAPRQVSAADRLSYALVLLGRGQAQTASDQLGAVLADNPRDPLARLLLSEIELDPKVILGERSRPYRVRAGETMTRLAQRFLGDGHLFYALARFNGIAVPDDPLIGRMIRIPDSGAFAAARAPRPRLAQRPPAAPAITPQKPSAPSAWRLGI